MRHLFLLLPALVLLVSCSPDKDSEPPNVGCGDFVEGTTREHYGREKPQFCDPRDGRLYVYVTIGEQTWMAENLAYEAKGSVCYGDGRVSVGFDTETMNWIYTTITPAEIQANCETYGRLYSWETAKKACPNGWHLPSNAEWKTLMNYAGGGDAGTKFKATSGWNDIYTTNGAYLGSGNGTDDYGFAALPGGFYSSQRDGVSSNMGESGYWQIYDKADPNNNGDKIEYNLTISLSGYISNTSSGSCCNFHFSSVRCLKN